MGGGSGCCGSFSVFAASGRLVGSGRCGGVGSVVGKFCVCVTWVYVLLGPCCNGVGEWGMG